jgi:hypothetical protein
MSVREILVEGRFAGIYLLYGHVCEFGKAIGWRYYIGQSSNIVSRISQHISGKQQSQTLNWAGTRAFVLTRGVPAQDLLETESRFICAAKAMKLPLANRALGGGPRACWGSLDGERASLTAALSILRTGGAA